MCDVYHSPPHHLLVSPPFALESYSSSAHNCGRCEKPFGALARWRHHCRKCGSCVCDACSPFRAPLPQIGLDTPVRICFVCQSDGESAFNNKFLSHDTPGTNHHFNLASLVFVNSRIAKEAESGRMDDGTMVFVG